MKAQHTSNANRLIYWRCVAFKRKTCRTQYLFERYRLPISTPRQIIKKIVILRDSSETVRTTYLYPIMRLCIDTRLSIALIITTHMRPYEPVFVLYYCLRKAKWEPYIERGFQRNYLSSFYMFITRQTQTSNNWSSPAFVVLCERCQDQSWSWCMLCELQEPVKTSFDATNITLLD